MTLKIFKVLAATVFMMWLANLPHVGSFMAHADAPAEAPLIRNGNFEADANGDAWPDNWGRLPESSWEKEGDNHFLRLHAPTANKLIMLYQPVAIPPGINALELTWRWRVSDLKPGQQPWFDARIILEFKNAAGEKLKGAPGAPYTRDNTNGWVERSVKFLVPSGAVLLEFMPSLFQVTTGTFDLDDVALKPTDGAPLEAAAKATAEAEKFANVAPEVPQPAKWPSELHVVGNQVLNKDGKPVWLQGLNVVSLEFLVQGDHVLRSELVAIDDWKANIIRLPVKEDYWFGKDPTQHDGGAAYRNLVDAAINIAANRGTYVLLDLHRFRAPRHEHVEFWQDAARRYKNHPAVLFDIFNEPHDSSWAVWRDGGFIPDKDTPADEDAFLTPAEKAQNAKGFHSVGMQGLINAIRAVGAHNIIVAGGLDWAYDLSGIAQGFELDDKGGNGIMYATHVYPWKRDWQSKVLAVADKHPILVGEVGADIKKMEFIPADQQEDPYTWVPDMLGFIQKYKLHWTAFSFHPGATPVMISDWHYTPTPFWGAFVKRALAGEHFEMKRMR